MPLTALDAKVSQPQLRPSPVLSKPFPVSLRFGCYFLLSGLARRQLLPSPASAGGQGPTPRPLSAPIPRDRAFPSCVWGLSGPTAQHRPCREHEGPRKPGAPTPHTPRAQMHNPPPFHLHFTFTPAFVTSICPPPTSLPSQLIFLPYPGHFISLDFSRPSISPLLPFLTTWSGERCPCTWWGVGTK